MDFHQRSLHLTTFRGFCILLTTEVVPQIFPNLNGVADLVVPVGWGSCPPRLVIFIQLHILMYILFQCRPQQPPPQPPPQNTHASPTATVA